MPLPEADASPLPETAASTNTVDLTWPANGSAALGAQGYGVLATHGSDKPRPTASLAKIITVLAILDAKPLRQGEQGPSITITDADVKLYNDYLAEGGAVAKVETGEKITEYQALQAMLLPSANNIADTMATWVYGSMSAYHVQANALLQKWSIRQTHVAADASGMAPDTTSTPGDMVLLGGRALDNPVIAEIINQKSAFIPVAGTIYSANARLGITSVIGIKTGLTDEAGGCFLFASKYSPSDSQSVTIVGVIMGEPTFYGALWDATPLANSARPYFKTVTPVHAGDTVARIAPPWQPKSPVGVMAKHDLLLVAWQGSPLKSRFEPTTLTHALHTGSEIGRVIVTSGDHSVSVSAILQSAIPSPSTLWRIFRQR
jgi:D-alanyl-D-alanine carboxypeptidase (penicillin-binding protein 5/6)